MPLCFDFCALLSNPLVIHVLFHGSFVRIYRHKFSLLIHHMLITEKVLSYLGWSFDKMFRNQFCMSSQRVSRWNFFTKIISSCDNEYSNTSIVLCFSFALEYKVPVDKVPLEYIRHSIDIIRSISLKLQSDCIQSTHAFK